MNYNLITLNELNKIRMIKQISGEGHAKTVTVNDLKNASPQYQQTVASYYRAEAASTIQAAYRHYCEVKKARKEKREFSSTHTPRMGYWQYYRELRSEFRAIRKLEEPSTIDEEFNKTLLDAIKNNKYHQINYAHKNFTACLFAAMRYGLIAMNQMMTAKLMYESLICFNKGKMPENPELIFHRFSISDTSSPYQPSKGISYWGQAENDKLQQELQAADFEKHHYYTINLPRHQAVGFLYFGIERSLNNKQFIEMLEAYIDRLSLPEDVKANAQLEIKRYQSGYANKDCCTRLMALIKTSEPNLAHFFDLNFYSTDNEKNLGLTFREFNHEVYTTILLVNLYAVKCQIPMFCIAPKNDSLSVEQQPLLSFVLPTIDALNMLQLIVHGEEATLPVAVIGQETPRMIRAYDDIPALKVSGQTATKAQELLRKVYPVATELDGPARPIELNYPGVEQTNKPHGADCHNFLLSWHDVFHAWRNGSNYKAFLRQLRLLHDERQGFALEQNAMSKRIWELTDIDFSAGRIYRDTQDKSSVSVLIFISILERAGYSFEKPHDFNYLFIYSLCQSPDDWGKPFGIDPKNLGASPVPIESVRDNFDTLKNSVKHMIAYLKLHPEASVAEVILHDLLVPPKSSDRELLLLLNKDGFKNIFYWSANTGLYFKQEYRDALEKIGINFQLRANSTEQVRLALKQLVLIKVGPDPLIKLEMSHYKWPDPLENLMNNLKAGHGQENLETDLFKIDEQMRLVLKEDGQPISNMKPDKLAERYFSSRHITLNQDQLADILQLRESQYPPLYILGDGRSGNSGAKKDVSVKTKKEMASHVVAVRNTIEFVQEPESKYDLLYQKYQTLFKDVSSTKNGLYTRKSRPSIFYSNAKTKGLTDTQLIHLSYLKSLFIDDVKKLLSTHKEAAFLDHVEKSIGNTNHFINFNRTRYTLFEKKITSSRDEIQKEITKTRAELNQKPNTNQNCTR